MGLFNNLSGNWLLACITLVNAGMFPSSLLLLLGVSP